MTIRYPRRAAALLAAALLATRADAAAVAAILSVLPETTPSARYCSRAAAAARVR